MSYKRFQPVSAPVEQVLIHTVLDTHTLGKRPGTYKQIADCTSKADAELVADALNHFFGE